jgi:hypothetical protein
MVKSSGSHVIRQTEIEEQVPLQFTFDFCPTAVPYTLIGFKRSSEAPVGGASLSGLL